MSDGDTVTILDDKETQHRVRLAGIDAPEKRQAFGNASKENLSRLIFDKRVEAKCYKRDRYRREVCTVFLGFRDVGLDQVREGLAWHYKRFASEQAPPQRAAYADAENEARASHAGLWSENPVPSWDWRQRQLR